MHFGEFNNPLDVLAAAATLQTSSLPPDTTTMGRGGSENESGGLDGETDDTAVTDPTPTNSTTHTTMSPPLCHITHKALDRSDMKTPCVIKLVPKTGLSHRPFSSGLVNNNLGMKDSVKHGISYREPSPRGLTVLRLPKNDTSGFMDHSYAFTQPVEGSGKLETEDDGYCSRSSLDSPGQSSRSDGDLNDLDLLSDCDMRSPTTPANLSGTTACFRLNTPVATPLKLKTNGLVCTPSPPSNSPPSKLLKPTQKPAKIVIVSRGDVQGKVPSPGGSIVANGVQVDNIETDKRVSRKSCSKLQNVRTVMEPVDSWVGYDEFEGVEQVASPSVGGRDDESRCVCDEVSVEVQSEPSISLQSPDTYSEEVEEDPRCSSPDSTSQTCSQFKLPLSPMPNSKEIESVECSPSITPQSSFTEKTLDGLEIANGTFTAISSSSQVMSTEVNSRELASTSQELSTEVTSTSGDLTSNDVTSNQSEVSSSLSLVSDVGSQALEQSSDSMQMPQDRPPLSESHVLLMPSTSQTDNSQVNGDSETLCEQEQNDSCKSVSQLSPCSLDQNDAESSPLNKPELEPLPEDENAKTPLDSQQMDSTVVGINVEPSVISHDEKPPLTFCAEDQPQSPTCHMESQNPPLKKEASSESVPEDTYNGERQQDSGEPVGALYQGRETSGEAFDSEHIETSYSADTAVDSKYGKTLDTVLTGEDAVLSDGIRPENTAVSFASGVLTEAQGAKPTMLVMKRDGSTKSPLIWKRTPSPLLSSTILPQPQPSVQSSPEPSKINIKISGSKVIDVTCSDEQGVTHKKAAASIGQMGSLSAWKQRGKSDVVTSSTNEGTPYLKILSGISLPKHNSHSNVTLAHPAIIAQPAKRAYKRRNKTVDVSSSKLLVSVMADPLSEVDEPVDISSHSYVKKRPRIKDNPLSPSQQELSKLKLSAQLIPRLHPLTDHDYCSFTDFSAEIQRSIIATTQNRVRTEKKFGKKTKAARTKTAPLIASVGNKEGQSRAVGSLLDKPKKRKYTRRKLAKKLMKGSMEMSEESSGMNTENDVDIVPKSREVPFAHKIHKRQMALEKKIATFESFKEKSDKNYVKIPGCYQDDFVYYATKRTTKRQRKLAEVDAHKTLLAKSLPVGGTTLNEFDWYREMAQVDKTKFGVGSSVASDSNPGTPTPEPEKVFMSADKACVTMLSSKPTSQYLDINATAESDVANLVVDMELENNNNTGSMIPAADNKPPVDDINLMAEQVRDLLYSMDESELQQLTENMGSKEETNTFQPESASKTKPGTPPPVTERETFPSMLDNRATLSQPSSAPQLLVDLDDINDSDLLPSDLGMGLEMLPELQGSASSAANTVASSTVYSTAFTMAEGSAYGSRGMDSPSTPLTPICASSAAPELTTVNMYWNDLPGLTINGHQYVRLVDIHKQVLPAKDTGILKKRCQMMGLEIGACTELQRDFLIRYMNAAKSKSCVITSQADAKTLIGFYVDPRPRIQRHNQDEESEPEPERDHTPLERSSSVNGVVSKQPNSEVPRPQPRRSAGSESKRSPTKKKPSLPPVRSRTQPSTPVDTTPEVPETPAELDPVDSNFKRSARLRQTRKVSYAALHSGITDDLGDDSGDEACPAPVEPPRRTSLTEKKAVPRPKARPRVTVPRVRVMSGLNKRGGFEEKEVSKLVYKKKNMGLNKREQHRLVRLRDRMKQKRLQGDRSIKTARWIRNLMKCRERARVAGQGHAKGDYSEEHCYASWHAKLGANTRETKATAKSSIGEGSEGLPVPNGSKEVSERGVDNESASNVEEGEKKVAKLVVPVPKLSVPVEKQIKPVEKPAKVLEKLPRKETDPGNSKRVRPKGRKKVLPLAVTHRDQRAAGSRAKYQDGTLLLHLYKSRDASCVRCLACEELMNIRHFLKHLHRSSNQDELTTVTVPQKLMLTNQEPSEEELKLWEEYEARSRDFELAHKKSSQNRITTKNQLKSEDKSGTNVEQQSLVPKTKEVVEETAGSNASTRHSTRIRKRKQLHPVESYVYSRGSAHPAKVTKEM